MSAARRSLLPLLGKPLVGKDPVRPLWWVYSVLDYHGAAINAGRAFATWREAMDFAVAVSARRFG